MNHSITRSRLLLGVIFFLSGMAALIYQVCWQRLLGVNYGVGPVSTAIIVSIFMLGLGIGALLGGRISVKSTVPVLSYILIEAGIGIFGILSLPLLDVIGDITAGSDFSLMILYVTGYLLIPTLLMGMTLPIVVRILHDINEDGLENVSFFYFINTIGAAFGAIVASYFLISFYGIDGAVRCAVLINFLLAIAIYLVTKGKGFGANDLPQTHSRNIGANNGLLKLKYVFPLLFVNGFLAIGYQIVWFRIAGVLLKDSAYSFSTILACYLLGIGVGSYWLSSRQGRKNQAGLDYYLRLNVLIAFSAVTPILLLYYLSDFWPIHDLLQYGFRFMVMPAVGKVNDFSDFLPTEALVIFWPFFLVFVPTFFMGAAFPVGISLLGINQRNSGLAVGIGYTVTVAGNTLGGLVCAFVLLPLYGSTNVLAGFFLIQLSYVFIMLFFGQQNRKKILNGSLVLMCGAFVVFSMPSAQGFYETIHPRFNTTIQNHHDLFQDSFIKRHQKFFAPLNVYFQEGIEGVVLDQEKAGYVRNYINGSAHGGRPSPGFLDEAIVGLSYSQNPRNVLLIGYGSGATMDGLLLDDRIEKITLVELNKTLLTNLSKMNGIKSALENKKVHIVIDDGRRYLHRTQEQFDVVMMEPPRSKSGFCNNINSLEFFSLVGNRLSTNGVFVVWTDDYTSRIDKGMAETFGFVNRYPHYLVATKNNPEFSSGKYEELVGHLPGSYSKDVRQVFAHPIRERDDILRVAKDFEVATDRKPRMEYYLGDAFVE